MDQVGFVMVHGLPLHASDVRGDVCQRLVTAHSSTLVTLKRRPIRRLIFVLGVVEGGEGVLARTGRPAAKLPERGRRARRQSTLNVVADWQVLVNESRAVVVEIAAGDVVDRRPGIVVHADLLLACEMLTIEHEFHRRMGRGAQKLREQTMWLL